MEPMAKITIRVPADLHRRVVELARRDRRSLNSEIIVLLEAAVERAESGERRSAE